MKSLMRRGFGFSDLVVNVEGNGAFTFIELRSPGVFSVVVPANARRFLKPSNWPLSVRKSAKVSDSSLFLAKVLVVFLSTGGVLSTSSR